VQNLKRRKDRRIARPATSAREITRVELARLIGSLPPGVRITIEFHVHTENPARADAETPLTLQQAAEALNVSERTITRLAGLEWVKYQGAGAVRSSASPRRACGGC
jgi:hypothetical protein